MNRRPWTVVVPLVVVVAVTGCGAGQASGTDQAAGELAEVKADRDHLAALVSQLSTTSATREAYTINGRKGCLHQLKAVRKRIIAARADFGNRKAAALHLDSASKGLDDALGGDCAPGPPLDPAAQPGQIQAVADQATGMELAGHAHSWLGGPPRLEPSRAPATVRAGFSSSHAYQDRFWYRQL